MKPLPGVRSASSSAGLSPDTRLLDACRQVEGLFIGQLLAAMERPTFGAGVLGQSGAARIFAAQRTQALAREMGARGELGLAEMLYRELAGPDGAQSAAGRMDR